MNCPSCEKELTTILARHEYTIKFDTDQAKWVKEIGDAEYACNSCLETLVTTDIEDILRQVDEL